MESIHELSNSRFSNGSFACLFPYDMYDKIPQQPLGLVVIKLDGSSFGIEVSRTGTIGEVKRAVELAFSYLPNNGHERISWDHVWSQFCLCYAGQKLLSESDCINMFGINDGDNLHFIRHTSNSSISSRAEKMQETESDDDHFVSDMGEVQGGDQDDEVECNKGMKFCFAAKLSNLLRGRSSKNPRKKMWPLRNNLRFSKNKCNSQRVLALGG